MRISFYIQPGAKKTELCGLHDGVLKIKIKAPPVDGAANLELIRFLSELFDIPKSKISLSAGQKSRHKTILIDNITIETENLIKIKLEKM